MIGVRFLLVLTMVSLGANAIAMEFVDPMRPPDFALKKYRLEKLKNAPKKNTVTATKKTVNKQWVLQSVIYSSDRKHAIVNDQLVRKGDQVDGARVVSIKPGTVLLSYKGKAINLSMKQLKPPAGSDMEYRIKKKSL